MSGRLCPVDGHAMDRGVEDVVAYHACPRCRGLWLSSLDWGRTSHNDRFRVPLEHLADLRPAPREKPLACPGCEAAMERHRVGEVEIDLCPRCRSAWFDAGELEAAVRWQRRGGRIPTPGDVKVSARDEAVSDVVSDGVSGLAAALVAAVQGILRVRRWGR